jgi:hypothetical protein
MIPGSTTERAWAEWLDAVEAAARSVEQQALVRDVPQQLVEAMPTLPMPATPWPASLEARRREVLATLAAATATVERRRDETGAALRRLAHQPSRPVAAGYADGASLDVLG